MPAADDRWDVVVVGLRDPSQANAVMVIAELAHYASLPPQDIENALAEGELFVLGNLDRAEAERSANELAELGAVVDLRLHMETSGVFPVFKPDAERTIGVAVGGLIDDSATPPMVGESMTLPELEPDLEGAAEPRTRPRTRTGAPGRGAPTVPSALSDLDGPSLGELGDLGGPPGLDLPPPDPKPAPKAEKKPAKKSGQRAAKKPDTESLLGDISDLGPPVDRGSDKPADEPKAAQKKPAQKAAPRAAKSAPPPHDSGGGLELDFEAAGMKRPPPKGGVPGLSPAPAAEPIAERSGSNMPRRSRAGMGGTGAAAGGHEHEPAGLGEVLRNDGISALLVGLAAGLVLAMGLGIVMQRGDAKERLPPLEEELAASLNDPDGVASGEHRDPAAVQGEIDGVLDEVERKFLLWWLIPGAVVGIGLSRLRAL